jgi:hypothetical protein
MLLKIKGKDVYGWSRGSEIAAVQNGERSWLMMGLRPLLCGKAPPFRATAPLFLPLRAAGRRCLPAARRRLVGGLHNGKAKPFRIASGEAAGLRHRPDRNLGTNLLHSPAAGPRTKGVGRHFPDLSS